MQDSCVPSEAGKRPSGQTSPKNMASKVKRENTDLTETRPKRKDHPGSRGTMWIKQNAYDAVCSYLNSLSDAQLANFVKKHKPRALPTTARKGVTRYYAVPIPLLVDSGAVHWIAKAILKERSKRRGSPCADGAKER
jgi:hypothetical protein